ncbi:hypothetical protein C7C46_22835 [Streptomyces tateyamensis]|uniref:Uncharacterized protein n=2 Tax=Streptomyces tateyamensis TaxID=565073 RepID=A0A2V4NL34_9ACTN|nr:hypothetical protein C7C46_22835 [Streptomyces tateyamensis]
MTVGAGAAVWAMNKANEATRRLTPDSLSGTAARGALQVGDAARRFAQEVKAGMAEREEQLRGDLGLDGSAVVEPRRRQVARDGGYRAISAAPGSPAVALPPSRRSTATPPSTPQTTASTPRQLEQRRGKHS